MLLGGCLVNWPEFWTTFLLNCYKPFDQVSFVYGNSKGHILKVHICENPSKTTICITQQPLDRLI